jgi:hypothetical protein
MLATPRFSSSSVLVLATAIVAMGCAGATTKPDERATEQRAAPGSSAPRAEHNVPIDEALDHFVPNGWVAFARARADLDEDGRQDMVALVEHERSASSIDNHSIPRSRYVIIVVDDEPFARLAAMNPEILRTKLGFGKPAPSVQLDAAHGAFSITQSGGTGGNRWSYTLNFQHHRTRSAWFLASCSFETTSQDVRGRSQSSTGQHSYPYTLDNDLGHFDRGGVDGFCPEL